MIGTKRKFYFWRPNNYRLQLNFNTETFKRNTTLNSGGLLSNFGTKLTIKQFNQTTIMVDIPKRKTIPPKITLIYKPLKRFYYKIKGKEEISAKVNEIEQRLLDTLNLFIAKFGGSYDIHTKKWVRFEDDIHGEDFIDKLPKDLVITDTYFKKVYQKGIEFKSPDYVKNYISNRAVEDIAPEIAEALNNLGARFDLFTNKALPVIEDLSRNIKTHLSVLNNIDKSFKKFNKLLTERQRKLKDWL